MMTNALERSGCAIKTSQTGSCLVIIARPGILATSRDAGWNPIAPDRPIPQGAGPRKCRSHPITTATRQRGQAVRNCPADGSTVGWIILNAESPTRGWHDNPDTSGCQQYWDGQAWTGEAHLSAFGAVAARYSLKGWRRIWFSTIVRFPGIFYPLAWFNSSVPITRGHLSRFMQPREQRELMAISPQPPAPPPPDTGVREPRRPLPSSPALSALAEDASS